MPIRPTAAYHTQNLRQDLHAWMLVCTAPSGERRYDSRVFDDDNRKNIIEAATELRSQGFVVTIAWAPVWLAGQAIPA